jgi:glutamate synthase domain-containing protein 3
VETFYELLRKLNAKEGHPLQELAGKGITAIDEAQGLQLVTDRLKDEVLQLQNCVYELYDKGQLDEIVYENVIRSCETIIDYSYTSIISPFPFHNCYSIEDVKAFIDVVHMINPRAVIAIKVSPSIDIEFIATGLARISKDNTEEVIKNRFGEIAPEDYSEEMKTYARQYGMKLEIWLDGPRGGTGASPNIIKGQMGMHIEYAIPLIHYRLVQDKLRDHITFMVSGGIRTYEDVIKAVALGADGVIWGTAPMVAIGCDRNRNCHDGCSRGIATSNLTMQKLRDVDSNTQQIINAFTMMQMQLIRALAALGLKDIRELRGRFDKIHWIGLKERVDHRFRVNMEIQKEIAKDERLFMERLEHQTGQSNCGVAAINGTIPIPGIVLDNALESMRNRGMDGVGIAKALCFPEHPNDYAYSVMVKGVLQKDMESNLRLQWQTAGKNFSESELRNEARQMTIAIRTELMEKIKTVFLEPYFDFHGNDTSEMVRESYKTDDSGQELDYRSFGNDNTDPGDIFRFFVRVKPESLYQYIEETIFKYDWARFFAHQFPGVSPENYKKMPTFLQKAEDVFVFDHGTIVTRILFVSEIADSEQVTGHSTTEIEKITREQLTVLRDFIQAYPFAHNKHRYKNRELKLATVMSNGKNFATWKTAGREIPWNTPDAPNNIIHVRLATGSVVEQMNAHPFTKLHTALTHNGETTNYEALKQRVEQFDLSPLATTDTEVAALKFYLTAGEWNYPDWALFESFSPTTGDDLQLIDKDLRRDLEQVQRVEFTSSPDGPYQYLCLRHDPANRVTERVDLKDPADLRPNTTAFWLDDQGEQKRVFSMIASEEQALHTMLRTMDELGVIEGRIADQTLNSTGMISRCYFDEQQQIYDVDFYDRYGRDMQIYPAGQHYSVRNRPLEKPGNPERYKDCLKNYRDFFKKELADISFDDFRWILDETLNQANSDTSFTQALEVFTWLRDQLRTLNPGEKAQSSLLDITDFYIEQLLDKSDHKTFSLHEKCNRSQSPNFEKIAGDSQTLVIDAEEFKAEGSDPDFTLAAFLEKAYNLGWRKYIIYRARGQRLISTAVMGKADTDDVVMDVYGSVGEYFGAFMQGGTIRLHGNAQNFCGMTMHHGELIIYGNAGKVNGYASKGGKVIILGNVVDRGWTNSVNDRRCQDLEVFILGSATKYAGESLMGGNFFFGGMHFDTKGQLRLNERPYLSTKMLGGASRGTFVLFDPEKRLHKNQFTHGKETEFFDDTEWIYYLENIKNTFRMANIDIYKKNGSEFINVDGKMIELVKNNFRKIVPRGGLKGYESH